MFSSKPSFSRTPVFPFMQNKERMPKGAARTCSQRGGAVQVFGGRSPSGWDHCKREGYLGTLTELGEAIGIAREEPQGRVLVKSPEPECCTVITCGSEFSSSV